MFKYLYNLFFKVINPPKYIRYRLKYPSGWGNWMTPYFLVNLNDRDIDDILKSFMDLNKNLVFINPNLKPIDYEWERYDKL